MISVWTSSYDWNRSSFQIVITYVSFFENYLLCLLPIFLMVIFLIVLCEVCFLSCFRNPSLFWKHKAILIYLFYLIFPFIFMSSFIHMELIFEYDVWITNYFHIGYWRVRSFHKNLLSSICYASSSNIYLHPFPGSLFCLYEWIFFFLCWYYTVLMTILS